MTEKKHDRYTVSTDDNETVNWTLTEIYLDLLESNLEPIQAKSQESIPEPKQEMSPVSKPESKPETKPVTMPKAKPLSRGRSESAQIDRKADVPRPKRRRFGFYKILLLIVFVLLVAISVGTYYFWQYIEAYEASRHERIIESIKENTDYDFWERSVENALLPLLSEFESDVTTSLKPHLHKIRDVSYSYRQNLDESTTDELVYIVRAGARDIGVLRLAPFGDAGYGFSLWEVSSMELLDGFVEAFAGSISVTASQNARVEVNGVPVTQEYGVECEFEHGVSYHIDGLFGEVEVSVYEFDGRQSDPYFSENGEFLFPIISPFARSYSILVSEGMNVFLDGERVAAEHISASGIVPEVFQGEVDLADFPYKLIRYEFELDGLYHEPIITADDGMGNELAPSVSDDGEISYPVPFSDELKTQHESTVESFIRAYINFGANIGNSVEGNFANVSSRMLRGSDVYRRTQGAISAMQFTSNVVITYNSLEIDNFRAYGDSLFTCEIRYDITHRTRYQQSEVEGNFEVLFVLSGGRWLAAKMVAV